MLVSSSLHIFFHLDFTIGPGVAPGQPQYSLQVADFTAGRELHPALKTNQIFYFKDSITNILTFDKQIYFCFSNNAYNWCTSSCRSERYSPAVKLVRSKKANFSRISFSTGKPTASNIRLT